MEISFITDRLKTAAEAVEAADLKADFRPIAFERALDVLGLVAPGGGTTQANPAAPLSGTQELQVDGSSLEAIASRLGVSLDAIQQIYEDDGDEGGLRLIIKRAMLPEPQQKAASMRHIALLLAVGRQIAGVEEYTPFALIRNECAELKVLDPSNFATEVGKLGMRRRGSRNKQEVKANRHHIDEVTKLIGQMTAKDRS